MFCGKCGTRMEDGTKFCPKCGNGAEQMNADVRESFSEKGYIAPPKTSLSEVQRKVGWISVIAYIVLSITFLKTMKSYYNSNMDAFDLLSDTNKTIAVFIYWMIPVSVICKCIFTISKYNTLNKKGVVLTNNGVWILVCGIILKLGRIIFDDWDWWSDSDTTLIPYRIFGTYSKVINVTLVIGILIIALGIWLQKYEGKAELNN